MKQLHRIIEAVYSRPWAILPSTHRSIVKQLESHLAYSLDNFDIKALNKAKGTFSDDPSTLSKEVAVSDGIAVISVDGIIGKHLSMLETMCGGVDCDAVAESLKTAVADPTVSQVVLYFNTPGGTVTGVRELADLIGQLDTQKPIYGYTDTLTASAGYWLASQCRAFYCAGSADIGSVGVYSLLLDYSEALAKEGVTVNAISAGKYKLAGASFKPLTEEERAMFQADVDKIFSQFQKAILSKRDIKADYLEGQVYDGETAVMNNLADGNLSSLEELLTFLTAGN